MMVISLSVLGLVASSAWFIPLAATLALLALFISRASTSSRVREMRRTFSTPDTMKPITVRTSHQGIECVLSKCTCRIDWSAISSWLESPNLFIVVDNTPESIIIPKRAFPDRAAVDAFRSEVSQQIQRD
jgi:hypothetical protein